MKCEYYQELISASIDNEISSIEQAELGEHLKLCSNCRQFADELKKIDSGLLEWEQNTISVNSEQFILSKAAAPSAERKVETILLRGHYVVPKKLAWAAAILFFLLSFNTAMQFFQYTSAEKKYDVPSADTDEPQNIVLTERDRVNSYTFYTKSIKIKELEKL